MPVAYATLLHVEQLHPARRPFPASAATNAKAVLIGDVEQFLADAEDELHVLLLRNGYDVPIASDATIAWGLCRKAVAAIAAETVERVAINSPNVDHYARMAKAARQMLDSEEIPGLERNSGQADARYNTSAASPMFSLEMDL